MYKELLHLRRHIGLERFYPLAIIVQGEWMDVRW